MKKRKIWQRMLLVCLIGLYTGGGVCFSADRDRTLVVLDKYISRMNDLMISSNQLILYKIKQLDKSKSEPEMIELRVFNINLEICKDFQIMAEKYYIYLSWLKDLYSIQQKCQRGDMSAVANEQIDKLNSILMKNLDFDIQEYIPEFNKDITDIDVSDFSNKLRKVLKGVKDCLFTQQK